MRRSVSIEEAKQLGLLPERFKSPVFILWELTYACLLRCIFCYNSSGYIPGPSLPVDAMLKIADEIGRAEVLSVCLSGGEPLLHQGYFKIAERLKEYDVSLGTPTSGWPVTREKAARMVSLFDGIQVSLDGATAETHDTIRKVKGAFERAMNALRMFDEEIDKLHGGKPMLSVAFICNKLNIHEFGDFVDLMRSSGFHNLTEIRVQPVVPSGRARKIDICLDANDLKQLEEVCVWKNIASQESHVEFGNPVIHLFKATISYPWESAVIDPIGNVRFSPWLPGNAGNILKSSLKEIWESKLSRIHQDEEILQHLRKVKSIDDMGVIYDDLEETFGSFGGGKVERSEPLQAV